MAITSLGSPVWMGKPSIFGSGGSPTFASGLLLNASGDRMAFVIQAPKSGTLDWFEFRLTTFTQATNGLRVSFQTIDPATGFPDGTQDQFFDITSGLAAGWITPSGVMTNDGTGTGTKRTVTAGEYIGLVLDFVSFAGGDSVTVTQGWSQAVAFELLNYVADGSTGTYAKSASTAGIFALKYSDGSYASFPFFPIGVPASAAINQRTYNTGSSPDERGMRFTLPLDTRVIGGWVRVSLDGDCDLVLYDNADTVLDTVSLDKDIKGSTSAFDAHFYFTAPQDLTGGDVYRLVVKPTTATSLTIYELPVASNARLEAWPGGTSWYLTTRTNAGAWTDTDSERPLMGLLIDGVETGSSGGGTVGYAHFG